LRNQYCIYLMNFSSGIAIHALLDFEILQLEVCVWSAWNHESIGRKFNLLLMPMYTMKRSSYLCHFFQICSCKFAINSSQRFCNLITMFFSSFVWICLYKLLLKAHKGMQNGFCKLIIVYFFFLLEFASIIVVNNSQGEQNGFTISSLYLSHFLLEFAWIIVINGSQGDKMNFSTNLSFYLFHFLFNFAYVN